MISRWGSGDTRDDGLDKLKASLSYEIKLKKAMEINNLQLLDDDSTKRILVVIKDRTLLSPQYPLHGCWADVRYGAESRYSPLLNIEQIYAMLLGQIIKRMKNSMPNEMFEARLREIGVGEGEYEFNR
jgi:hypothetical protein